MEWLDNNAPRALRRTWLCNTDRFVTARLNFLRFPPYPDAPPFPETAALTLPRKITWRVTGVCWAADLLPSASGAYRFTEEELYKLAQDAEFSEKAGRGSLPPAVHLAEFAETGRYFENELAPLHTRSVNGPEDLALPDELWDVLQYYYTARDAAEARLMTRAFDCGKDFTAAPELDERCWGPDAAVVPRVAVRYGLDVEITVGGVPAYQHNLTATESETIREAVIRHEAAGEFLSDGREDYDLLTAYMNRKGMNGDAPTRDDLNLARVLYGDRYDGKKYRFGPSIIGHAKTYAM